MLAIQAHYFFLFNPFSKRSTGTTQTIIEFQITAMSQESNKHSTIPLAAGTVAGAASTILLYPLDLIKVRLQVNESSTPTDIANANKKLKTRSGPIVHMIKGIIRHEGVYGLYNGISPAVIGSSISWGGYFFFYEGIKKTMLQNKKQKRLNQIDSKRIEEHISLGPLENFTAACLSGAIMVGFTNPIWLIKTRMQLQIKISNEHKQSSVKEPSTNMKLKPPYKNVLDAAKTIYKEEGVAGLYKGSIPALMLVSHGGVQFVCYEFLKGHFGTYQKSSFRSQSVFNRLEDSLGYLAMGAMSKIVATTATYPIQLIKSRLQQRSQTTELSSSGEIRIVKRQYSGVIDCVKRVHAKEGFYGFFKGCLPNAIRVAPSAAITFVVYESISDFL